MSAPLFERDALSYGEGDLIADRYRVTGVLGRGGFGAVYAAEHTGTLQAIAIKMLTSSDGDESEANQRFHREARITAALSSPNTVRVFDVGRAENGPLFLAMELLKGPTLEQVLKQLAKANLVMSERQALDVGLGILNSLAEAHAAGLVHRDLKPANIMLADVAGGDPVIKVLDFGCSTTHDSELTQEGTVLGTPGYMSPEQCRGEPVDARSDLYALGVMLYRCVTGRLPFKGDQPLTLIYKHAHEPVPDPREVSVHEVSEAMAAMLLRVLAKSPDDRYANAQVMRSELRRIAADVQAEPRNAAGTHTRIQRRGGSVRPLSSLLRIARGESAEQSEVDLMAPTDSALPITEAGDAQTVAYGGHAPAQTVRGQPGVAPAAGAQDVPAITVPRGAVVPPAQVAPAGDSPETAVAAPPPVVQDEHTPHRPWVLALLALLLLGGAVGVGLFLSGGDVQDQRGASAGAGLQAGVRTGSGTPGRLATGAQTQADAASAAGASAGAATTAQADAGQGGGGDARAAAGAAASAGTAQPNDATTGPASDAASGARTWIAKADAERDPRKRVALLERGLRENPKAAEMQKALDAARAALAKARARARAAEAAAERARREAATAPAGPAAPRPRLKGVIMDD